MIFLQPGERLLHGMARSLLLGLVPPANGIVPDDRPDLFGTVSDHHVEAVRGQDPGTPDHAGQHGLARNPVQHLGQVAVHA